MRILILALAILLNCAAINPACAAVEKQADDAKKLSSAEATYFNTDDGEFVKKFLKPGTYLRASEVRPGMEGYGLSVFRGTKIERFNVKVIGVMKRVNNGKDAILVRLSGAAMGKNNVIRGMSGSPVYIDDKLIGAISYGFDFSTEPVAGVTPIVDMLDAMAKPQAPPKIGSREPFSRKISLSPSAVSALPADLGKFKKMMVGSAAPRMVPLMSPVCLSGFSTRAQDFLRHRLESIGLSVSEGQGGALDSNLSPEELKEANALKPGSAMGVMLTTGDFESASTGTVTANFDGRILGFGHPFVEAGLVDFPMSSAYILDVLPSLSISFKLSAPVAVMGTLFSDRPWSVGGQVGSQAKMLPVTIEVVDSERHIRKKFSSKVIDHEDLTPELVAACTMSAVDATYQSSAPYVARVETVVEIENSATIKRFDCLTNSYGSSGMSSSLFRPFFSDPVSGNIHSIASRVLSNRYKKVRLKSVNLKINLETGRDLTRIVRVSTDRPVVKPGETVTLSCLLEPYDGETYTETIDVEIPRSVPDGDLVLGVSGGSQFEDLRKRMNLIDPPTTSLEQIIRRIQDRPRGDRLFAVLALPNQAIHVDGEVIDSPPGHWNKLFFSNRYTHGPSLVNGERKKSKELSSLVEGTHIVAVTVKRPDPFMEVAPWYIATPGGSGKPAMGAYVTSQAQKAIDALNKTDTKAKTAETPAASGEATKNSGLSLWSPTTDDTHIRPVQVWSQTDDSAFKGGTRDGVIIDSWGRMFPGFKESGLVQIPALRAWSAVWSKGAVYIAATNKIYRWSPGSAKPEEIAKFDSVAIPAIAADSKGRIYAALAPGGRVVAVDPAPSASAGITNMATLSEPLVTSLAIDGEDNLYAGVAETGKVYKITAPGAATMFVDTGDAHVLSMFFDRASNRLYMGCGEQGNVYSAGKDGQLRAEYHCDDHLITGVCRSKSGDLFITTCGSGRLVRICPSGETYDLATSEAFYTLFYHPETDSVFAGDAEGDITQIQEEPLTGQSFFVPVKHTEQEAVVALCCDGANHIYAVTSNLPSILDFTVRPETATFTSPIKDATRQSRWSLLRVYGSFNEISADLEKNISVETRTGETIRPDSTWSAWTPCLISSEGYQIKSRDGRYFQYRLKWLAPGAKVGEQRVFPQGRGSVLGRVTVTFLPTNIRPRFSTVSLRAGTYVCDTEEVSIVGTDPDGDSLSLTVETSSDNGTTWKVLKSDLRAERTLKKDSKTDEKADKKGADKSKKPSDSTKKEDGKTEEKSSVPPDKTRTDQTDDNPSGNGGTGDGDKSSDDKSADDSSDKPKGDDSEGNDKPSGDGSSDGSTDKPKDGGPSEGNNPSGRSMSATVPSFDSRPRFLQLPPRNDPPKENRPEDKNKDKEKPDPGEKPDDEKKPGEKGDEKKEEETKKGDRKTDKKAGAKPVPAQAAKDAAKAKKTTEGSDTDKFVWSLVANTFKNGHHILRFTLSDAPSNMVQPSEIKCYRYVVIDTVKPNISQANAKVSADHYLTLDVTASDATSPIANATFAIDAEEPRAFAVVDGLADKRAVRLQASGVPVKKSARKVEIEISDRAGNKATKTLKIPAH